MNIFTKAVEALEFKKFAAACPGLAAMVVRQRKREKIANQAAEIRRAQLDAQNNLLALGIGGGTAWGMNMAGKSLLGPWHTPATATGAQANETAQIVRNWLRSKKITPSPVPTMNSNFAHAPLFSFERDQLNRQHGGAFAIPGVTRNPTEGGANRNVIFSARQPQGTLLHEGGHLANFRDIWGGTARLIGDTSRDKKRSHQLARLLLALRVPVATGGAILGTGIGMYANKEWGDKAWTLPLLAGAPLVAEEGIASARGLNALRKAKGLGAALRGVPRLGAGLATYAALPVGGGLAAYLANRWKSD